LTYSKTQNDYQANGDFYILLPDNGDATGNCKDFSDLGYSSCSISLFSLPSLHMEPFHKIIEFIVDFAFKIEFTICIFINDHSLISLLLCNQLIFLMCLKITSERLFQLLLLASFLLDTFDVHITATNKNMYIETKLEVTKV